VRFSVLLLTQDEELQVEDCLRSLAPAERIVVIDSGSTDRTLEIVRGFSRVTVVERPFLSFADQRNFGLSNCFSPGEWVLHLDADERIPADLARELGVLEPAVHQIAFNIASRTFLGNRPVPRASGFPVYQTRLTRAGVFSFEEIGHAQKASPHLGALPNLRNPYDHHPFEKGLIKWRERHEMYAAKEAADLIAGNGAWTLPRALRDSIAARQWLKHATFRLPGRPELVWLYLMFVRGGVSEGPAGWAYCKLRWSYERLVDEAVRRAKSSDRPNARPPRPRGPRVQA
jgi:glycosyltransferase involved in cell wall biosynthesis